MKLTGRRSTNIREASELEQLVAILSHRAQMQNAATANSWPIRQPSPMIEQQPYGFEPYTPGRLAPALRERMLEVQGHRLAENTEALPGYDLGAPPSQFVPGSFEDSVFNMYRFRR